MNHPAVSRWSPMVDDEFAGFIDFGDINLSAFGDAGNTEISGAGGDLPQEDGAGNAMETTLEGGDARGILDSEIPQMEEPDQIGGMNGFPEAFPDIEASANLINQNQRPQQHSQQQQHAVQMPPHGRFYPHNTVPPTPNSLDLHGNQSEYYQNHAERQQQLVFEHYRRHQNDQMNFTPLVSPAVTPLDTQFQNSEYAASTDCFSPLTSPALRAQNHNVQYSLYGSVRGSDTSDTTSPVDMLVDYPAPTSGSTPGSSRRSKRTASSSSTKNTARSIRQSPVVKPQSRRKQPSSTVIPAKEVASILEEAQEARRLTPVGADGRLPLPLAHSHDSSGADSVSPESLSEILMPPPATPKPGSAGRSPVLEGKPAESSKSGPTNPLKEAPATPASLMRIRKQAGKHLTSGRASSTLKEQAAIAESDMEQIMEDISLPQSDEPGKKRPPQRINIAEANENNTTSAPITSKKTTTTSAPVTATGSSFPSPLPSAVASPNGGAGAKRSESAKIKPKDSKKRGSVGNQISPALRPKISPNIKPLLPEGTVVSPETSVLLLASRSNYQNIIEGNNLPGVSYPETLSSNLTSKRTSHKLAEQGRRNRINTALQEIATLLPPQSPPANGVIPDGQQAKVLMTTGTAAQQNSSKASTVELAIDYIKSLQSELKTVKDRLKEVEEQQGASGSTVPSDASNRTTSEEVETLAV